MGELTCFRLDPLARHYQRQHTSLNDEVELRVLDRVELGLGAAATETKLGGARLTYLIALFPPVTNLGGETTHPLVLK
ncbi:hypothetical protein DVH05_009778 [Phytophthora capsici]|nr:hypothetical protein DVH05_009778 [Phytophthora capsici]